MRKTILIAALPLTLGLAACGEPIDGSDTADMEADAVTAPGADEPISGENPAADGMLETEVQPTETPSDTIEPAAEQMMEDSAETM